MHINTVQYEWFNQGQLRLTSAYFYSTSLMDPAYPLVVIDLWCVGIGIWKNVYKSTAASQHMPAPSEGMLHSYHIPFCLFAPSISVCDFVLHCDELDAWSRSQVLGASFHMTFMCDLPSLARKSSVDTGTRANRSNGPDR